MNRTLLALYLTALGTAPLLAQTAAPPPIRPVATSDVGPWEAVIWANGKQVHHCTMSRARKAPEGVSYAVLVDTEVVLLGVESAAWKLTPGATIEPVLTPEKGKAHKAKARAVSPTRANIDLQRAELDTLQQSAHVDVEIAGKKVRLPFDDFNAGRVVLESCVQQIGKEFKN